MYPTVSSVDSHNFHVDPDLAFHFGLASVRVLDQ
jgi:hypothetical protein